MIIVVVTLAGGNKLLKSRSFTAVISAVQSTASEKKNLDLDLLTSKHLAFEGKVMGGRQRKGGGGVRGTYRGI